LSVTAPSILTLDAARPGADVEVQERTSMAEFLSLETEWNALVEASDAGLFLRHECVRAWIDAFAPDARLVVLIARDRGGRLVAALPLVSEWSLFCGLPARQLVAAANTHSCRFDLIALNKAAAGPAFLAHLSGRSDWDILRIIDVPVGGNAWEMYRAGKALGLPVGAWEAERSPYLSFPASYAALLARKSPLFRANLRRRRRQLERLGALSVERVTDESRLMERLEEGFELERRGWKGKKGTAIAQDERTRAFYTQVARDAARHGHLALFFLRLDGRAIAFHFGLVHRGVYYVPKLAYDETLEGCSPGLVLLEEAIKDGIARGLKGYDFLGDEAEWKDKWSSTVRPNHWLFIFRDTVVGRALCKSKFEWLPAVRRTLLRSARPLDAAKPALFVPAFPTIRPEALLRFGADSIEARYPFSAPSAGYFYFARNAIWQAVKDLGLYGGDVLVPAYHHGVEIEALIDAGARVKFYSIGAHFEVDFDEVEALIGPETRALYLTHFLGFPGPVREMKALASKHGLPLIEDCALSLFSADGDLPLGTTGDAAIFCLYKVLAVPDGGVLVYRDSSVGRTAPSDHALRKAPPLASSAAVLASSLLRNIALRGGSLGRALRGRILAVGKRALKASKVEPVLAGTQHFNRAHALLGPSLLTRRLLRVQDVAEIVSRRRRNYDFLLERLRDVSTPLFDALPAGVVPLCYPLLVEDNRWFMEQLVARGIEAVDFWREGHPACAVAAFPDVARLRASVVEIPCHQDITLDTLALMVTVIRHTLAARPLFVIKDVV
jgi:dTDP-4-amino-4,6-dideoxygalactose transaminase/CelD/BcsL family acetyltransferase involved in cellulose biosynthesis